MGSFCSCLGGSQNENVSSSNHPFNQPGRTLDSTQAKPASTLPSNQTQDNMGQDQSSQARGPGRTLASSGEQPQRRETDSEMRAAAAKAAEVRAQGTKPKGKLGQKLDEQQRRTGTGNLEEASKQEVGARKQDEGQAVRSWE